MSGVKIINKRNCPNCKQTLDKDKFYQYRCICKKCYYKKQQARRKKNNKTIPVEKYNELLKKYEELKKQLEIKV